MSSTAARFASNRNVIWSFFRVTSNRRFLSPPQNLLSKQIRMISTKTNDLLRLPVPSLNETAQKYLRTVEPLLNADELKETKQIVELFKHESQPLQKLLQKRAETEENWLSQWWLDKTYLEWRSNLPIFYNPAVIFPRQPYRDFDGQLKFSANFLYGALLYRDLIDHDRLPIDRFGNDNLCMDQYKKIFGTCRVPAEKSDILVNYNRNGNRHAAIFFRNQLYRLPLYDPSGEKLSAKTIYNNLKKLENDENGKVPNQIVGHLTADQRQLWAPIHEKLSSIEENREYFQTIHDSLLVLCIDEKMRTDGRTVDANTLAAFNFLHGDGTTFNTANRWFDKTIQVIVGPDGYSGLNYEHSLAEGGMITALSDFILDYCRTAADIDSKTELTQLTKCHILIPKQIEPLLIESQKRVDKFIENCDLLIVKYSNFGKNFAKNNKLSIDAIIQVALQVAYYRMHGKCGATYESGSLRRYRFGRTETIRSCTNEALQFSRTFSSKSKEKSFELFSRAIKAQREYTNDALNAKGIDRHLLGLRLIAAENQLAKPKLFDHFSYKRAMHFILSTSQVAAKNDCVMVYGAAVDDGYGCCYNPRDETINYMLSSFKINNQGTDVRKFAETLNQTFDDIRQLIEENSRTNIKSKL